MNMGTEVASFSQSQDELTAMDSMKLRLESELAGELKKLDLTANEAKILLFLMSNGSSTASDISKYTKIQRTDTYHYIGILLSKGIVFSTFTKPQKYYSLSYAETIDYLVQAKSNSLREVSEKKLECQTKLDQISNWVSKEDVDDSYQVLAGENVVVTKLSKVLSLPVRSVSIFVTDRMLAKLYHQGVIEQLVGLTKTGTKVRLKTPTAKCLLDDGTVGSVERRKLHLEEISNPSPASFVIIDRTWLLLLIDANDESKREITGIHTNNGTMVSTLEYLFERIV